MEIQILSPFDKSHAIYKLCCVIDEVYLTPKVLVLLFMKIAKKNSLP